jgi:twinkle protein
MDFTGDIRPLKTRAITEETCRKFNVRYDPATKTIRFPYYTQAGQLVAFKSRDTEKDFTWTGKNSDHTLFGQQLWGQGKSIVITEGEIDCLSVYQARPTWPVVSIPNGANAAKKALQHQIKWLLGFDEIVLLFDNDEAGQEAAQDCATLFPHDKLYIATIAPYKDANEAAVARDTDAIRQAIWNKKPYTPQSLIKVDDPDLIKRIVEWDCEPDGHWHHPGLDEKLRGLHGGRVYTVAADTGVGKTTFLGELVHCLLTQGHTVGWIALEEDDVETAMRLMTISSNTPADLITDRSDRLCLAQEISQWPLYLSKDSISCDADAILSELAYLSKGMGCKFLILDHLSMLMSGSETNDEQKLISLTMTKLKDFVTKTRACLIQVVHVNTIKDGKVNLYNLRGSRTIGQLSDAVIAIERDTREGDDDAVVRVLKNRPNRGRTGIAGLLRYNPLTGRQLPYDGPLPTTNTTDEDDPF